MKWAEAVYRRIGWVLLVVVMTPLAIGAVAGVVLVVGAMYLNGVQP